MIEFVTIARTPHIMWKIVGQDCKSFFSEFIAYNTNLVFGLVISVLSILPYPLEIKS